MRIILLGPPGIGKGTQAKLLARRLSVPHLSSGDILRSEIDDETDLGMLAQSYINEGRLVPDEVILDMMIRRLKREDACHGYILDGFPRTVPQAEGLEEILERLNQKLDAVVAIEGDSDIIVQRLSSRRSCSQCGAITNLIFSPPKEEGTCDHCGGELYQREDDKPEVIQRRLEVFQKQTEPLIHHYAKKSLLRKVNGVGTINEVTKNILKGLE